MRKVDTEGKVVSGMGRVPCNLPQRAGLVVQHENERTFN